MHPQGVEPSRQNRVGGRRWGKPHSRTGVGSLPLDRKVGDDGVVAAAPGPVRVLVVDDQAVFRSVAQMVVELTNGFEVAGEAASGEEAVRLAGELVPDLVLTDIKMSGIGGLEAARCILAAHRGVRVLALSTYEEYAQLALDAGAAAFICKADFDPDRLVTAWAAAS